MVEIEEIVISVIQIGGRKICYSRHGNALPLESICGQKHISQCFLGLY